MLMLLQIKQHISTRANSVTNLELSERKPPEAHSFGRVTITEFSNNEKRRGDFEKVIPLLTYMMKRNQIQLTI